MELENKPMSPAPLLVVLASFDPNGNGINDCDENNPAPLTDKTSPLYGEQWCFSTPAEVYDRFFGGKYSLTAYYNELSANKFTFYPVKIDHMQEGGLEAGVLSVAVKLPHPAALRNLEGYDNGSAAAKAIAEIVKACDPYIDFAKYDSDGDGIVNPTDLAIVILNAGFDHSSTKGDLEFSKVDYETRRTRFTVYGSRHKPSYRRDDARRRKVVRVSKWANTFKGHGAYFRRHTGARACAQSRRAGYVFALHASGAGGKALADPRTLFAYVLRQSYQGGGDAVISRPVPENLFRLG